MAAVNYPDRLLRDIGRVFQLPPYRSPDYIQIQTYVDQLFTTSLDRDSTITAMSNLLNILPRIPEKTGRADERITTIDTLLQSQNFIPTSILDIGAGTGDITTALMNYYRLPPDRVFAIDQKLPSTVGVTALTYVEGKIPLPDSSIDLVILFAVLHHIPPEIRPGIMSEIYRVVKPGGLVIIREHDDNKDPQFFIYLDLYHILWYIAKNETSDPLYLLSRSETQDLFRSVNFTAVGYHTYPSGIPNPKRMYHEMFKKHMWPLGENKKPTIPPVTTNAAPVYQFSDPSVQLHLQNYINRLKDVPDLWPALPTKLQTELQSQGDLTRPQILKAYALNLITTATQYLTPINGIYYLTTAAIDRAAL